MSWIRQLYDVYEHCEDQIGKEVPERVMLFPLYHITQQAHIEAMIDSNGNWCPGRSRVLEEKNEMTTLIPCTEKSAGRAGTNPVAHPLFDKLYYLAGDFEQYSSAKKSGFADYLAALKQWNDFPGCPQSVRAIYRYLSKGTLTADLIADGTLVCGSDGRLLSAGKLPENPPPILKLLKDKQYDAFVRFAVISADGQMEGWEQHPWKDPAVWQSFIDYQESQPQQTSLCYVLGKELPPSSNAPKKIRNSGDQAKLISANDNTNYTYRGRFTQPHQAYSISREATEKAHNALRWLISRQGYVHQGQAIVSFSSAQNLDLDPCCDGSFFGAMEPGGQAETGDEFARRLNRAIAGYKSRLEDGEQAVVMGLDAATPGRLSIFYYKEMDAVDFLGRIRSWHTTCRWLHAYARKPDGLDAKGKTKYKRVWFIGAPSPADIAEAAYGRQLSDSLKKKTVQELLSCIVDGTALPRGLMCNAARRASNPVTLEDYEKQKVRSIACALIYKFYNDQENRRHICDQNYREVWKMGLDQGCNDRSYLFGRLLAYAHNIELFMLRQQGEDARGTNAERLQAAFSLHPAWTWHTIRDILSPYLQRMNRTAYGLKEKLVSEMQEVASRIPVEEFNNSPLNELYLLGYDSQLREFYQGKNQNGQQASDENEEQE